MSVVTDATLPDPSNLLSTAEAAMIARCSTDGLRALIRRGRLRAYRFGERRLLVNRDDLLGLLKSRAVR